MNLERMGQLYDYVYSTPMDSPEREKRLAELSDTDQAELYDFAVGLLSGRISRPESEGKDDMNILSYQEWKHIQQQAQARQKGAGNTLWEFESKYPAIASEYRQRELQEQKQRDQIMQIKDRAERQKAIAANISLF